MSKKVRLLCILLVLCTAIQGQNRSQATLLKNAYKQNSTSLLYQFFDNWSNAVSSNENEAKNKWVAEAHKVYAAFYQPLQLEKIGCRSEDKDLYEDMPYFIVQGTLDEICIADTIPLNSDELVAYYTNRINQMNLDEETRKKYLDEVRIQKEIGELILDSEMDFHGLSIPTTKVGSSISFRPPVNIPNKKIVYLTTKYKRLLDNFLGNRHVGFAKESIMQVAYSKGESRKRMDFFNSAARIFYGHWGGYWQYETYPKATSIVFDSQMQRAVVFFRFVYEGGEVILEKQNGEWTIVSSKLTWME
ncbi:MAG: hypothetical protein J5637_06700 [Prevotella sp.]|nr:hypothetical protein [Prevotella sp.]